MFIAAIFLSYGFGLYNAAWITNPYVGHGAARLLKVQSENSLWLTHLLLHVTLMHGIVPDSVIPYASTSFLSPAWSLSLEWQFYVVAPLMVAGLASMRGAWFSVLLLIGSAVSLSGLLGQWWGVQPFLLLALPLFFAGITSRLWLDGETPWIGIASTLAALLIYGVAEGAKAFLYLLPGAALWGLFLVATAKEVGRLSFRNRPFDVLLRLVAYNPTALALGRVSYSTYLAHVPIMTLVIGIGVLATRTPSQPLILGLTAIAILLTAPISFLLHHWVEQPGIRLGKWMFPSAAPAKIAPA